MVAAFTAYDWTTLTMRAEFLLMYNLAPSPGTHLLEGTWHHQPCRTYHCHQSTFIASYDALLARDPNNAGLQRLDLKLQRRILPVWVTTVSLRKRSAIAKCNRNEREQSEVR